MQAEQKVSEIGGVLLNVVHRLAGKIDDIVMGAVVMLIFWGIAAAVRAGIRRVAPRVKADTSGMFLVARLVFGAIIVVGAATALNAAGIDWAALGAGLGLTGFALGFALKDAISNYVAGALILFYRPFRIGDRVKAGNIVGVVKDIRVRDTVIIDDTGLKTIIPNSNVFGNIIVNYTESDNK